MVHKIFFGMYDAFRSVEMMRRFVETHGELNYSVFDLDWKSNSQENLLLLIMSLSEKADASKVFSKIISSSSQTMEHRLLTKIRRSQNAENGEFMDQVLDLIFTIFYREKQCFLSSFYDSCVFAILGHPATTAFLSSCDANAFLHVETHHGSKKIVFTVNQPISAGDMITVSGDLNDQYYQCRVGSHKCTKPKAHCPPCRDKWAYMLNPRKLYLDLGESIVDFFERNNPKQVASVLKHRWEVCDFINQNFTDYYKDSKVREKIASKKEELRRNLNFMNDPMPQTSPFIGLELLVNKKRYELPGDVFKF